MTLDSITAGFDTASVSLFGISISFKFTYFWNSVDFYPKVQHLFSAPEAHLFQHQVNSTLCNSYYHNCEREIFASPALSSSGTGPRCESTRQHTNDATQPKCKFMAEPRVPRKKNMKSAKKFKKSKKGSLKLQKKKKFTQRGLPPQKRNFNI